MDVFRIGEDSVQGSSSLGGIKEGFFLSTLLDSLLSFLVSHLCAPQMPSFFALEMELLFTDSLLGLCVSLMTQDGISLFAIRYLWAFSVLRLSVFRRFFVCF